MKIAIFYHVHPVYNWITQYNEQIHRVCSSRLYHAADFIHVGFNSHDLHLPYEIDKVKLHRNNVFHDEFDTLTSLYNFCISNKGYNVLYFSNLGVTKPNNIFKSSWRMLLEYFIIDNWKQCNELLNNYDCVGAESHFGVLDFRPQSLGRDFYMPHYSGNWWWATSDYIATLKTNSIDRENQNNSRENGEYWIGTGQNVKHYNLYSSGYYGMLHENIVKPTDYIN